MQVIATEVNNFREGDFLKKLAANNSEVLKAEQDFKEALKAFHNSLTFVEKGLFDLTGWSLVRQQPTKRMVQPLAVPQGSKSDSLFSSYQCLPKFGKYLCTLQRIETLQMMETTLEQLWTRWCELCSIFLTTQNHYGILDVNVPTNNQVGNDVGYAIDESSLSFFPGQTEFINSMKSFIKTLGVSLPHAITIQTTDALLFVHGYNNSFTFAAQRIAQLVVDTDFKGMASFFSWPSQVRPRNLLLKGRESSLIMKPTLPWQRTVLSIQQNISIPYQKYPISKNYLLLHILWEIEFFWER